MKVKKMVQEMVFPSMSHAGGAGRVMQLSMSDKLMPLIYVPLVIFFKEKPGKEVFENLKDSLAKTLSLFYPCAGRLREKSSSTSGELEITCNDAGALLVEAWLDSPTSHFSSSFEPHPDFSLLVPPLDPSAPLSSAPLLLAQMTHFECEHASLGISFHHTIFDVHSMGHFLSSWSSILTQSNETMDLKAAKAQYPLHPYLDRSILNANPLSPLILDHPEYQTQVPNYSISSPSSITKLFSFTPSYIKSLREKANLNLSSSLTRFEALAAHLWHGINIARCLPPDQETRLAIAVDGRKRFDPPLPEEYFGNAIFFGFIYTKAKYVVGNPFSYIANQVKSAVAKVNDTHMRSALNWYEKQENPKSVCLSFWRPQCDVVITSWWRIPFYDLDFGWGTPSYVRSIIPRFDGAIVLLPSPLGPEHVDVLIDLQVDHMTKLEAYINLL